MVVRHNWRLTGFLFWRESIGHNLEEVRWVLIATRHA